ncbi:hypothetical protein REPUB_Repub20aG0041400 [Reevesia pubescens]
MYLGLPLGFKSSSTTMWDPVIKKYEMRLSKWKASLLSMSSRLILVKVWRYVKERDSYWKAVIDCKYGNDGGSRTKCSFIWRNITSVLDNFSLFGSVVSSNVGFLLEDGSLLSFWEDEWVEGVVLKLSFPRIFALAVNKGKRVKEFGIRHNNLWSWDIVLRRNLFDWELHQWATFLSTISNYVMCSNMDDSLIWKGSSKGALSVWSLQFVCFAAKSWKLLIISSSLMISLGECGRIFVVFKGRTFDFGKLVEIIIARVSMWCKAKWPNEVISLDGAFRGSNSLLVPKSMIFQHVAANWVLPPAVVLKFNVDGAFKGNSRLAGIRGVIRDDASNILMLFSNSIGIVDIISAKILAIKEAFLCSVLLNRLILMIYG